MFFSEKYHMGAEVQNLRKNRVNFIEEFKELKKKKTQFGELREETPVRCSGKSRHERNDKDNTESEIQIQ